MSGQKTRNGVAYGCHADLADGEEPDDCVIDYGSPGDCIHATFANGRNRTSVWTCRYWRPTEKGAVDG